MAIQNELQIVENGIHQRRYFLIAIAILIYPFMR